ncbi:Rv1733c family protein [Rhodococcus wratislaviensis]
MRPSQSAPVPVPTPIRWRRLRPWSRNHLMRRSDRYEATLVLLTAILVLLLIPFAAAFGTATHTRLQHQTQELRAGMHQVPAVLLKDTCPAPETAEDSLRPTRTQNTARARWSTPHGDSTPQCPPTPLQRPVRRSPSTPTPTPTVTSPAPSPAAGRTLRWP